MPLGMRHGGRDGCSMLQIVGAIVSPIGESKGGKNLPDRPMNRHRLNRGAFTKCDKRICGATKYCYFA